MVRLAISTGTVWYYPGYDAPSIISGASALRHQQRAGITRLAVAVHTYLDALRLVMLIFHVVKNGTEIFGHSSQVMAAPASRTRCFGGGDTIDFLVGRALTAALCLGSKNQGGPHSGHQRTSPAPPPPAATYDWRVILNLKTTQAVHGLRL